MEEWPQYCCPRCGARSFNWQGMRLHFRDSARCFGYFEDTRPKVLREVCRKASQAAAAREAETSRAEVSERPPQLLLDCKENSDAEEPAIPKQRSSSGVGAEVLGACGSRWGRVVAEERHCWRLEDGRTARKAAQDKKWRWAPVTPECASGTDSAGASTATDSEASAAPWRTESASPPWPPVPPAPTRQSPLLLPDPAVPMPPCLAALGGSVAEDEEEAEDREESEEDEEDEDGEELRSCARGSGRGVGCEIRGSDGRSWGLAVAEERSSWRLEDGRRAKKATEGKKWTWHVVVVAASAGCRSQQALGHNDAALGGQSCALPEIAMVHSCDWLPLSAALRAAPVCRDWSRALSGRLPLLLPPPQVDALLQFCLLEVLASFDDSRLPFPVSAVYSEMRAVARRAAGSNLGVSQLEAVVCHVHGRSVRAQQEQLLAARRPHHIAWTADVRNSGFRSLERLARHFDSERLIETFRQRWNKRIHHTPNTRTCTELLLTKVNRSHPLFVEHLLMTQRV